MPAPARANSTRWCLCLVPLLPILLVGIVGCGGNDAPEHPTTYPVTGTVVAADGTPLTDGMIELRTAEGKPLSAMGMIQPDGTFELSTMSGNQKLPGAVAGLHQVTVIPPSSDPQDIQSTAMPISLPTPVEVRAQAENQLTVKLPGRTGG